MVRKVKKMALVVVGSAFMLGALGTSAHAYQCVDRDTPACAAPACCKLA